jgi:ribosome-binding factor A
MPSRIEKVNKHIQRTFGEVLHEIADLPPDVLVTVARADTTYNLKSSTVWLYIFPEDKEEEIMLLLKPQMYELQGELNRRLDFKPLPRISLRIDHGAKHSQQINETLGNLE